MPRHVTVEDRDGIALVRIDRPPANAMDLELLEDGAAVLEELERGSARRRGPHRPGGVLLRGRRTSSSPPPSTRQGQRDMVAASTARSPGWYSFPRPVVCAVNGHAIAGGLILALCGDHRIGTDAGQARASPS